jgi:predicted Zn-ribbon and HTH transcriptional regulator
MVKQPGCCCLCHAFNDMDRPLGEPSDCIMCDCEIITQAKMQRQMYGD